MNAILRVRDPLSFQTLVSTKALAELRKFFRILAEGPFTDGSLGCSGTFAGVASGGQGEAEYTNEKPIEIGPNCP
jgi:hypothetical protein